MKDVGKGAELGGAEKQDHNGADIADEPGARE